MEPMILEYTVSADDFSGAGEASGDVKRTLKSLGFPPEVIRRVSVAMYEAEINMVIHARGGKITVGISPDEIRRWSGHSGHRSGHAGRLVHSIR